ncbi:nuclear transport factor 2 family protein [Burkholderia sp. Bp9017]|uniref:Nuclear transport factor 2 family protein n=1 Tax=Burkholderia anthina TaxID=179879 RepID=A0A7T6VKS8_9BURK|nr:MULTISPECIES: nuclear transport factor 2 family protein [Burkholderia]MBY4869655.1 nuclear transport factor 2 family protein [Burkholderia anthina]QQK05767.1 nuclear transport factor 2 family protein [Burkholderia anthina]RQZ29149.1 nuclear transport factor 2 family protein [Burkholderia sp. Bp9017]RQZ35909.1 nuclear transport factor 2 family protein [Burkholderia sp. Bp9016]
MTHTDTDARRIHENWHAAVVARDFDALMSLYADDAILETPLVVVTLPDRGCGVLHGKAAIGEFFAAGLRNQGNKLGRWYRTGQFFSNGQQITWEYPREAPEGDQVDLVEVMDLRDGLIAHHRVYWGWVGFMALRDAAARTAGRG